MGRLVAVLVAVCALAGCGGAPQSGPHSSSTAMAAAAPTTPRWSAPDIEAWTKRIDAHLQDMDQAFASMSRAIRARDFASARSACKWMGDSARALRRELPGPSPKANNAINVLVTNIEAAEEGCATIGPDTTQADADRFLTNTQRAFDDASAALGGS